MIRFNGERVVLVEIKDAGETFLRESFRDFFA